MASTEESSVPNPDDCFKILLATDIHLGYKETDDIIGNDSFVTFAEILEHAKIRDVDFILLGGDLFHDAEPSKGSLNNCLDLLRRYVMGDKEIKFDVLSEHEMNFYDENTNIAIPVLSIHGNHDDPSGYGRFSSMDLMSTSGLMTYFGRCDNLEEVNIHPILLKKGQTQLALYGLSHIHDNRLSRLFRDTKVFMHVPDKRSGQWFNIMALHQNRADRGPKNYIPEEILPDFLDFVLWGHEHDCRVEPEPVAGRNFFVSQPGSSVATSLSEGESIDKHIAVLHVCGDQFKLEPIKLQTVRPFVFKTIQMEDYADELEMDMEDPNYDIQSKVQELLRGIVNQMIEEAKGKLTNCRSQPKIPLIRLRVLYKNDEYNINETRFSQQFTDMVANPTTVLKIKRYIKREKTEQPLLDGETFKEIFGQNDFNKDDCSIIDWVKNLFEDSANLENLQASFVPVLSEFCRLLAEHGDNHAGYKTIELSIAKATEFLTELKPKSNEIDEALEKYRLTKYDEVTSEILKATAGLKMKGICEPSIDPVDDLINGNQSTSKGRGSRASTTTTAKAVASKPATSGRGRGSNSRGRAVAESARNDANVSVLRSQQPTIQQSMGRTSTRPTQSIIYDDSDSD